MEGFYVIRYLTGYHLDFENSIPARFRVPVSDFRSPASEVRNADKCGHRNSGESETRLSESDGGQAQLEYRNTGVMGAIVICY